MSQLDPWTSLTEGSTWVSLRDPSRTKRIVKVYDDGMIAFTDSERGGPYSGLASTLIEYYRPAET